MRLATWLLTAVLAVIVGGCSADPSAETWAAQVCQALDPWKSNIDDLTAEANSAMSPKSSPSQAKKDLVHLMSGAAKSTDNARSNIVSAGIPDVDGGAQIAERFTKALSATHDAYRDARDGIEKLDSSSQDFYESVAKVMDKLSSDYDEVPQVAQLDSSQLRDAFDSSKQCR